MKKRNLGFRSWFYFRMGWGVYFTFLFAGINTLTVTYYLAIENIPTLKDIFPSFTTYVLVLVIVGIPLLVTVGWVHYRRTAAYGAEAEIQIESNPYFYKAAPGWQIEVFFPAFLKLSQFLIKYSQNEKFTENEIQEIKKLEKKLDILIKGGHVGDLRILRNDPNPNDIEDADLK